MASLLDSGQQHPLVVVEAERESRYIVIDGYKRVRALTKLQLDQAMVTLWELDQAEALVLEQLMRSSDSSGPIEQGWPLVELRERFALSQEELARRFDKESKLGVAAGWLWSASCQRRSNASFATAGLRATSRPSSWCLWHAPNRTTPAVSPSCSRGFG